MTTCRRCRTRGGHAYVDMAGSAALRAAIHHRFGDRLVYSGRIGLTHQDAAPEPDSLPGAKPLWFFAPDQIRKRVKEWGSGGLEQQNQCGLAGRHGAAGAVPDHRGKPRKSRSRTGLSRHPERPRKPEQGHILSVWD